MAMAFSDFGSSLCSTDPRQVLTYTHLFFLCVLYRSLLEAAPETGRNRQWHCILSACKHRDAKRRAQKTEGAFHSVHYLLITLINMRVTTRCVMEVKWSPASVCVCARCGQMPTVLLPNKQRPTTHRFGPSNECQNYVYVEKRSIILKAHVSRSYHCQSARVDDAAARWARCKRKNYIISRDRVLHINRLFILWLLLLLPSYYSVWAQLLADVLIGCWCWRSRAFVISCL